MPGASGGAAPRPARDTPLDVLRGWAIVLMLLSHVGSRSHVSALAHLPVWISAAEPFVILAGVVLGMRMRAGARSGGLARVRRLWVTHLVLMTAGLVVHETTGRLNSPSVADAGGFVAVAWKLPLLRLQALDFMNILPLFVVFFLAAEGLVRAMDRGFTWPVLVASFALWCVGQRAPEFLRFTDPSCGPQAFVLTAWQFAFVVALAAGYHRAAVAAFYRRHERVLLPALAVFTAACFVLAQLQRSPFASLGARLSPSANALVAKETWGPLRAPYVAALMFLAYLGLGRLETVNVSRLVARARDALAMMGRASLYGFLVHLPIALAGSAFHLERASSVVHDVAAVLVIAYVFVMAKHEVGKRLILG